MQVNNISIVSVKKKTKQIHSPRAEFIEVCIPKHFSYPLPIAFLWRKIKSNEAYDILKVEVSVFTWQWLKQ